MMRPVVKLLPNASSRDFFTQGGETVATAVSDAEGKFLIEALPNGMYDMTIKAAGFLDANVNVTVEGYVKDLIFVGMVMEQVVTEVDDSNFAEFDMDDSGFEDAPSILFDSNDPFTNIASFGFSNIRFKNRGYTNESQDATCQCRRRMFHPCIGKIPWRKITRM